MSGYLDEIIDAVRVFDAARPRSKQQAPGWSEVGGCRRYLGYRLDGEWPSDRPDTWGAQRGTAIHEYLQLILASVRPGVLVEVETMYRGIPGHADIVEKDPPTVVDIKGLALTTPMPTPGGWTTMAAVQPGDEVFGSDGHVCKVTIKSPVKRIGTYVVRFHDGSQVVCDREHLWLAVSGWGKHQRTAVVGVEEMADTLMVGRAHPQCRWRVPVAMPLDLPDRDVPVSPYVLGCWLADGSVGCGRITKYPAMFDEIEREGCTVGPIPPSQRDDVAASRTVYGLMTGLRALGVLHDRRVPDLYLRASIRQRQDLVRGLMDGDGSWNTARRRVVYTSTTKALASAMFELLVSLGEKPHESTIMRSGFGVTVEAYDVEWSPLWFNPFRMPVKASRVVITETQKARARYRSVTSIERGPDVASACIAVDSPDSTYLCGTEMIPTHNTTKLSNSRTWQNNPAVMHQKLIQINGYAAGLIDDGMLPEDTVVRLLVVPVDGTFADWWCFESPFDRALADEGADRLDWVRAQQAAGEKLPKDMPLMWCQAWCEFSTICRVGDADDDEEITDPELVAAIGKYGQTSQLIGQMKRQQDGLADMIRGLHGRAGDWRISMTTPGSGREVLDEDLVRLRYDVLGEEPPTTVRSGSGSRLSVTRIKGSR